MVKQMDVRDQTAWQSIASEATAVFGQIDYLFNFAGIVHPSFIYDADLSLIDSHIDINAKGTLFGTKVVGDIMKEQGSGHIINIASLAGIAPVPGIAFYTASKFAVRGFSLAASYEYEPFGVTISVVCPDLVKTPMYELELQHPEETALVFSGSTQVLTPEDVTRELLRLMKSKKREICIPESRGWLAKVASVFPWLADAMRGSLIKKGLIQIQKIKQTHHAA
jgi:3-oxoacyl-[acyl-carrier protein] reductase